jgi:hypothetical protein
VRWSGHIFGMSVFAGVPSPAPDEFADLAVVHAVDGDGDGTALCQGHLSLERVDHHTWSEVPDHQRCRSCTVIMDHIGG